MLKALAIVLPVTALAWFAAPLPGFKILGPLGLALLAAAGLRAVMGMAMAGLAARQHHRGRQGGQRTGPRH